MTFTDIREIVCLSIPKCHFMVIVVNLIKWIWVFVWCCLLVCMLSQCWVFPPLAVIIVAGCRGIVATRRCRRSTGISAHLSSRACRSSPRFWGGLSILVIAQWLLGGFPASPHSIQITHPCWQDPNTYEAILLDHPQQSTVLTRCGLPWNPHWLAWHQSTNDRIPPEDAIDGSKPVRQQ